MKRKPTKIQRLISFNTALFLGFITRITASSTFFEHVTYGLLIVGVILTWGTLIWFMRELKGDKPFQSLYALTFLVNCFMTWLVINPHILENIEKAIK